MQNNIAKYRKEARLSQQELADAINVSRKTIKYRRNKPVYAVGNNCSKNSKAF